MASGTPPPDAELQRWLVSSAANSAGSVVWTPLTIGPTREAGSRCKAADSLVTDPRAAHRHRSYRENGSHEALGALDGHGVRRQRDERVTGGVSA